MKLRSMAKSSGPSTRGRGRPSKTPTKTSATPSQTGKRGRGRPPKNAAVSTPVTAKQDAVSSGESSGKKRGRPRKTPAPVEQDVVLADHAASQAARQSDVPADSAPRRGRGRPPKRPKVIQANGDHGNDTVQAQTPTVQVQIPLVDDPPPTPYIPTPDHQEPSGDHSVPAENSGRKRGRPRKRGKTDFPFDLWSVRPCLYQTSSQLLAPPEPTEHANKEFSGQSQDVNTHNDEGDVNAYIDEGDINAHIYEGDVGNDGGSAQNDEESASDMASGPKRVKKGIARPIKPNSVSAKKSAKDDNILVNDGEDEEEMNISLKTAQKEPEARTVGRPSTRSKTTIGKKRLAPALEFGDAASGGDGDSEDEAEHEMPAKKKQRSVSVEPKSAAAEKAVTKRNTMGKAPGKSVSKTSSARQSERAPSTRPPSRAKASERPTTRSTAPTATMSNDSIPEEVRPVHTVVPRDLHALDGINSVIQQLRQAAHGIVTGAGSTSFAQIAEGNGTSDPHDSGFGMIPSLLAASRLNPGVQIASMLAPDPVRRLIRRLLSATGRTM